MTSQFQILTKIIDNKDYSLILLNNLSEAQFFDYKAEFNFVKAHYEQYGTIPDRLSFLDVFPHFIPEGSSWHECNEPDTYLLDRLFSDYNSAIIVEKVKKMKQLIESGDEEAAHQIARNFGDELSTGAAMTCTDIFSDTSRYERYVQRATDRSNAYINTGFPELDTIMGGIDKENENMVIAARTGIGKSWTLIKMATEAAKQGYTVGFYSGEMSKDKVAARADTFMGGLDNRAITRGDLFVQQEYKRYMDSLANGKYAPFKVLTPSDINGPATVDALKAFVEREHIQILFIDQYSLLEDTSRAKQMFEKVGNISKAVKNLQVMKKIPIISVCQMNRTKGEDDGKGGKKQDTTQIGLADRIAQDATAVIMLDRAYDDNVGKNVLTLNVVKARDGGDGNQISYFTDFNTGSFNLKEVSGPDKYKFSMSNRYGDEEE